MNNSKEDIARGYDKIPAEKFMPRKFHRRCVRLMRPHLFSGATVADFGCGQGTLLQTVRELPLQLKLAACDLSPVLVSNTKRRVPDADVRVADIEALPFGDASFNAAFATEVMEHLATPLKALTEIHRVLKPGGWLLVSVPNRDWFNFQKYFVERTRFQPVDDHFYRVVELEEFVSRAGFKVHRVFGAENLYFGGGLLHFFEKIAIAIYPRLQRRMKRAIVLAQKPANTE